MLAAVLPRLTRFALSGFIATGVNYGALFLFFAEIGLGALAATTLAFIVSSGANFFLQKFWTYGARERTRLALEISGWTAASALMLAANDGVFFAVAHLAHAPAFLAQIAATGAVGIIGLIFAERLFGASMSWALVSALARAPSSDATKE